MPRRSKGPRLWLRRPRKDRAGRTIGQATWIIIDGNKHVATGCAAGEAERAQRRLSEHIAQKYEPTRTERALERIDIADVLSIYYDDVCARVADPGKVVSQLQRLNAYWGGKPLASVTGAACRDYTQQRGTDAGARRDLETLRAAINHHAREGLHRGVVRVTLPPRRPPRQRFLSRDEVAHLIWAAWRAREVQTVHRGPDLGQRRKTAKRPLAHIARFILLAVYTGTRASAIAAASTVRAEGRSFVDLDAGIFYRLAQGKTETNKRQPPVPIPPRLLAHLRRWHVKGIVGDRFIEWNGASVASIRTGFRSAVSKAGLSGKVTPHTLRHTAATWLMQAGVDLWEAAGFLGMSVQILERVYGHHHPAHLRNAARAIGYWRNPAAQSLAIPLVMPSEAPPLVPQAVEMIGGPGRTRTCNQIVMSDRL